MITKQQTSVNKYFIQAMIIIVLGVALSILGAILYHEHTGKHIFGDNTKQNIFFISICVFIITMFILLILHNLLPSAWYCKAFGWHRNKSVVSTTHDGASQHGHCNLCNKDVMKDSQGGWF